MRKLAHWTEQYTVGESVDILTDLAEATLLGSKDLRDIAPLVRKRKYEEFCRLPVDKFYQSRDWQNATRLRQAQAYLQKFEELECGIDRQAAALETWWNAEKQCKATNELFKLWKAGKIQFRPTTEASLHRAQRIIADVLGDVPRVEDLRMRFGPGATSLTKKRDASLKQKLSAGISCSEELVPWASTLLAELPHLTEAFWTTRTIECDKYGAKLEEWLGVPVIIHTGVISFAYKNFATFRPTETQPVLNGLFQLGIGDEMSSRCKRSGLNLRDQSANKRAAIRGSFTGEEATLDLSSASDTNATELVAHLLPVDWFSLLNAARVKKTRVPGTSEPVSQEKFSAMGNGFTFPLESLIFWALTRSVVERFGYDQRDVCVYGDDIIVPVECFTSLVELLTDVGFSVNTKKSYWQGPFRESCGVDALIGIDIRPVYVKYRISPAVLFALHNGLFRRGDFESASRVRAFIHPDLQLEGPDGYGDGHLLSENWEGRQYRRQEGHGGFIFDTFARIPKRDRRFALIGERVLPSYTIYRRSSVELVPGWNKLPENVVRRVHGRLEEPSAEIPLYEEEDQFTPVDTVTKATTLPGDEGYKKIAIYTFTVPQRVA